MTQLMFDCYSCCEASLPDEIKMNTCSYLRGGTDPKHIYFTSSTTDFNIKGISFILLNHCVILNNK